MLSKPFQVQLGFAHNHSSKEIRAENEEINRRCRRWSEAWVDAGQGLGLTTSGGIEACNGKK